MYIQTWRGECSIKSMYMLIKLEGIQFSVKVRGKIFNIQVNVYYHCVKLIIFRMNLSVFGIMSRVRGEQKTSLEGCQKYLKMLTKQVPFSG